MNRGCPNCGCKDNTGMEAFEATLRVCPWYFDPVHFEPKICLNCGTIYIDASTLGEINARIKEHRNNDENSEKI